MSRFAGKSLLKAVLLVIGSVTWLGCGGDDEPAGEPDAQAAPDAGTPDAGEQSDAAARPDNPDPIEGVAELPWVRPGPGGRYFQTEEGEPFLVIGNQPGTGFLDLPDDVIEAHFARMEQFGESVVRLDFDYFLTEPDPTYVGLESRVGTFDPARIARIDRAVTLAADHGIRILAVPWLTSPPLWESWSLNPYSTSLGGPARDPYDFLISSAAREAFGARLEWISARWGGEGALFGWDLMNESDVLVLWDPIHDDPESLSSWVLEIGTRTARFETSRHGRSHPRVVSWSEMIPPSTYSFLFDSAGLDAASTHPYEIYGTQLSSLPSIRTSVVQPAIDMHDRMRTILGTRIRDRRPYFENERHFNHVVMSRFHREADHDLAWAELASGAAGIGITWMVTDDGDILRARHENLGSDRRAMRDFVDLRVPAELFLSETEDEELDVASTDDPAVFVTSVRRGAVAMGWLVGMDERCVKVDGIDEVRAELEAGTPPPVVERAFAIVLWRELLAAEGVPIEDRRFDALIAAAVARDTPAIAAELDDVFGYLEELEAANGTLASLAACPELSPSVSFAMPAGAYDVDWIDDRSATVLRSDELTPGGGALTPPTFERHLAFVVRPRG